MAEQEYFKKALSNVMFDAASGGAIRHLADLGYTVKQIAGAISFPAPYEKIQQTVWKRFIENGTICIEEPGSGRGQERFTYVTDQDKFGKSSFRRVSLGGGSEKVICWRERNFSETQDGSFSALLAEKCTRDGEEYSYISCDFGLRLFREPEKFGEAIKVLEEPYRDYILGLPWERKTVYHRLNRRMREIAAGLYENGEYQGECFFMKSEEKIICRSGHVG